MAEGKIDLKRLTVEELSGVVNIYPWFGAARKELCERMVEVAGAEENGGKLFTDAAMYIPCRRKLAELLMKGKERRYADADVEELIRRRLKEENGAATQQESPAATAYRREVQVPGGDYFSQADYDGVRQRDDSQLLKSLAAASSAAGPSSGEKKDQNVPHLGFYTQTLAEIYAEQGYFEEAKQIYSQLILAYPEKSAYFASLIEKLN